MEGDRNAADGLLVALEGAAKEQVSPIEQALWMLFADFFAAAVPILPVTVSSIPNREIWMVGGAMLALLAVQALSTLFVDYQGHVMGAKMEGAMRQELFEHYQSTFLTDVSDLIL